jgi:signal transduction histidine kinase
LKFRFAARVIAQLGAELISSDDIAVYELIKNAFDAGSSRVKVAIRYVANVQDVAVIQAGIRNRFKRDEAEEAPDLDAIRDYVQKEVKGLQPIASELGDALRAEKARVGRALAATDREDQMITLVGSLNGITISDTGTGMDQGKLQDCFLTIGTTNRLKEHEALTEEQESEEEAVPPPAGEKGIGRLSAMRLGNDLVVRTWTGTSKKVNVLTIDWRVFNADSPLEAQEFDMDVKSEPREKEDSLSGTVLAITDLQSSWDEEKTRDVAARFLSRFLNPFEPPPSRGVDIVWNGQPIDIPTLSRKYLDAAHNGMKGKVTIEADRRFTLTINYWFRSGDGDERKTFWQTYSSADFGGLRDAAIAEIGPFTFELYHYNRPRITAIPGVGTRTDFRKWLDEWAGGLMLYRNGLRVMPYGRMPDDDWLELDRHALRSRGFRVNRIQVVGCVKISRTRNPLLKDQTNREGLRDNSAAKSFRKFLQRIIQELFVKLLDQEVRPAGKTDEELISRSADLQGAVEEAAERLSAAASEADIEGIERATQSLRAALSDVPRITADLRDAVQVHAFQRLEVLELAATGMTAMSLAHDLEAALDTAVAESGALARSSGITGDLRSSLEHLVALFKSLRSLVADIKPGPAKTRRRKSTFDVVEMSEQLVTFYRPSMERSDIEVETKVQPPRKPFRVKAVEGHVRQILDNLFRNAIYWVADTQEKHGQDAGPARIRILFDRRSKTLSFSDTGVGIAPHDSEWIFEPFTTHREGGFGLGLYISKELCKFNGIGIRIDPDSTNKWRRNDKFVLDFSECFVEGET